MRHLPWHTLRLNCLCLPSRLAVSLDTTHSCLGSSGIGSWATLSHLRLCVWFRNTFWDTSLRFLFSRFLIILHNSFRLLGVVIHLPEQRIELLRAFLLEVTHIKGRHLRHILRRLTTLRGTLLLLGRHPLFSDWHWITEPLLRCLLLFKLVSLCHLRRLPHISSFLFLHHHASIAVDLCCTACVGVDSRDYDSFIEVLLLHSSYQTLSASQPQILTACVSLMLTISRTVLVRIGRRYLRLTRIVSVHLDFFKIIKYWQNVPWLLNNIYLWLLGLLWTVVCSTSVVVPYHICFLIF